MLLRAAKSKAPSRGPVVEPLSVVAPIDGWNVRDSIASMKPTDAVILDNWWPTTTDCQIRGGYNQWATGLSGTAETVIPYNPAGGARKLFAITSTGNLYDVTANAPVGAALVTGLTNGRWQFLQVTTLGGSFILAANGADNMLRYDGTNWVFIYPSATGQTISTIVGNGVIVTVTTAAPHLLRTGNTVTTSGAATVGYNVGPVSITVTGANTFTFVNTTTGAAGGTPIYTVGENITGVNPANVFSLSLFKHRVWLVEKNSLNPWYLALDSIQGAATLFPIGPLFDKGGFLQGIPTWTIDGGQGMDDNIVFVSSAGQVLVYKGTDPSTATTFAETGVFNMGEPIGNRFWIKWGGDVVMITDQGLFPMATALLSADINNKTNLTDKILPAIAAAVAAARSSFGWQVITYPSQNMLLLNIPGGMVNYQVAMNTITGAWCRFPTGFAAACFASQGNSLYFGAAGYVGLAWSGNTDAGASIVAEMLPAFNYFGRRGYSKDFKAVKPIFLTNGAPTILGVMNLDFDTTPPAGSLAFTTPTIGMVWNAMIWGSMVWGGGYLIQKAWQAAVGGSGDCGAFHFKVQNNGSVVKLEAITYVFELGGIIG